MSKIGMRPISFKKASISVEGSSVVISCSGKKSSHELPAFLNAQVIDGKALKISVNGQEDLDREVKTAWGLHRALLASKIIGLEDGFTSTVRIVGLGFKAATQGNKLVLNLGYSHKIEMDLDPEVSIEIDKVGQLLTLKSSDKFRLGNYCAKIRSFRKPEPYKGTGIFVNDEKINKKAGKSKS